MQRQHRKPGACPCFRVFAHLAVAGRVAEGETGPASDHQIGGIGLADEVVVEEQLRILDPLRLSVLGVFIAQAAGGADHLLQGDTIDAFRVDAHEILTAPVSVSLKAVGAQVLEKLDLRQVDEVGVRSLPACVARGLIQALACLVNASTTMLVKVAAVILIRPSIESLATASRSPDSAVLNASSLASSGFAFTTAGTRSKQKTTCVYIGCSTQSVPSWSAKVVDASRRHVGPMASQPQSTWQKSTARG